MLPIKRSVDSVWLKSFQISIFTLNKSWMMNHCLSTFMIDLVKVLSEPTQGFNIQNSRSCFIQLIIGFWMNLSLIRFRSNLKLTNGFDLIVAGGSQQTLTPTQAVQQQVRLQRLQLEQDRLRQRQQEIIAMVGRRFDCVRRLLINEILGLETKSCRISYRKLMVKYNRT